MSFYGSEPTQNTSVPHQNRLNRGSHAPWSGPSLDHLLFQDSDFPVAQMGGLRRPNPKPPPADPNFPLVDPVPAEITNFPADQVDNDRLMLETRLVDFDLQRRVNPSPSHFEPPQRPVKSQPPQTPTYRQPTEHPSSTPLAGCNVPLPPEAFDIAADLNLDPSADILASRGKNARPVGLGTYVQQLMNFNREQQRGTKDHSLENFWKPLIASYFAPDANLHIDLKSSSRSKPRQIRFPVEALPRIWKSKLEAGVSEERTLLEDPCEFLLPSGFVVVDCPRTVILTTYQNSVVQTDGHLRVSFHRNKKIAMWEFSSKKHEELFTKRGFTAGAVPAIPPSACSEFGIPAAVVRLMMIANDVNDLADKIGTEISKLMTNPERLSAVPGPIPPRDGPQPAVGQQAPPPPLSSNGNAYRALSSMLDGPQLEQGDRRANLNTSTGRPGTSGGTPGLPEELDTEMKKAIELDNSLAPNFRDAMTSWRSDSQTSLALSNFFDEAFRVPLAPDLNNTEAHKNAARNQADAKVKARQQASGGANLRKQRGQSAIEAVAAAASGQGGWGVGATGRDVAAACGIGEDIDQSLQLFGAATDPGLRGGASRVGGPPPPAGLSLFTPQSTDLARSEAVLRRERGNHEAALRSMTAPSGRTTAGGQALKDFEGLRGFQRMPPKSKRETLPDAGHDTVAGSTHGEFAGTTQGIAEPNGAVRHSKAGGRSDGAKSGKDRTNSTAGSRRNAHRNASADERMEKRQKTANGEK